MRSAEELRSDFLVSPDLAHLNHGSFGAAARPVLERQAGLRRELEANPVEFLARRLPDLLNGVRARVAEYVGAADRDSLVFLPNSTTAVNAVAASFPLREDDEVVLTGLEYGAMRLLWDEISARTGARVVVAPVRVPIAGEAELTEAIWGAVTPRTRLLFVSHITSETALLLPVAELCRRARSAGITSVVDGAHGPGQVDLELDALGADCYAGNGHKWLCAPKGSAFLYARPGAREWLVPTVVSWGWSREGADGFHERFAWSGTDDPTAVLALPAAIDYLEANEWPAVRERCAALARRTQARVLEQHGGLPLAPAELQAPQMITFPVPFGGDVKALQADLFERHQIEIPAVEVGGRACLRLSVQGYVTEDDCERLVSALETFSLDSRRRV